MILLPLAIGVFLLSKGAGTFTTYRHSIGEFLFSSNWNPADDSTGGGTVGAAVYIAGSLITCGLALLIAVPFSLAAAIFMFGLGIFFSFNYWHMLITDRE